MRRDVEQEIATIRQRINQLESMRRQMQEWQKRVENDYKRKNYYQQNPHDLRNRRG